MEGGGSSRTFSINVTLLLSDVSRVLAKVLSFSNVVSVLAWVPGNKVGFIMGDLKDDFILGSVSLRKELCEEEKVVLG